MFISSSLLLCSFSWGIRAEPGGVPFSTRTHYNGPYNSGDRVTCTCYGGQSTTITCESNRAWTQKPSCPGLFDQALPQRHVPGPSGTSLVSFSCYLWKGNCNVSIINKSYQQQWLHSKTWVFLMESKYMFIEPRDWKKCPCFCLTFAFQKHLPQPGHLYHLRLIWQQQCRDMGQLWNRLKTTTVSLLPKILCCLSLSLWLILVVSWTCVYVQLPQISCTSGLPLGLESLFFSLSLELW